MANTNTHRETILTTAAPAPIGPYTQAVAAGPFVFCSGQIGLDPTTGALAEGLENQTRQVMANIAAVLAAEGCTFADVVKTRRPRRVPLGLGNDRAVAASQVP